MNVLQIGGKWYYGKCLTEVEPTGSYDERDYRMTKAQTSQRILPPSELDNMLSASKWSPPFPVCHDQQTSCRNFADDMHEPRASSAEGYSEAVDLWSHSAVDANHGEMSDYEGQ